MKMTNREYRQFLLEGTSRTVRLSYFMLLDDCIDLIESRDDVFEGVSHFEREIIKVAVEMENILSKEIKDRQSEIDRLLALKKELGTVLRDSKDVQIRTDILRLYLEVLRGIPAEGDPLYEEPAETREILGDCGRYVTNRYGGDAVYRAAFILSLFPLKMAREKYYDYIRLAIGNNYGHDADYMKALLEKKLKPELLVMKGYEKESVFASVNEALLEIWASAHEATDFEAYEEVLQETEEVLHEWNDRLFIILESINYCLIVMHYATDMGFLLEDDFIRRDISSAFVENMKAGSIELLTEAMRDNIEEIIGEWLDIRMNEVECDLERSGKDMPEDIRGYQLTQMLVDKLFDEIPDNYLSELFENNNTDESDSQEAGEALNGFMACMRESLASVSPKKQRVIKQNFLRLVPCVFEPKEWTDYLEYVYNSADLYQRRQICRRVYGTFKEQYFRTRYVDGEGEGVN